MPEETVNEGQAPGAGQPQKKGLSTLAIVLLILGGIFVLLIGIFIIEAFAVPGVQRQRMAANEGARTTANEAAAAASCKAYAEAQEIYHRTDYNRDGVLEYATALQGKNSLLETEPGAGDLALIDRSFAMAEGPPSKNPIPKAGYCFKILTAQGPAATGGARSYMDAEGKHMTGGYALLAYPAQYDSTGRSCYIINNNGTVFQADLGEDTPSIVEDMTEFNPDKTKGWSPTE